MNTVKKYHIKQRGLTLIELMISIVLGLIVIAAGLAIYLSGQRSLSLQNGMGELQQSSVFGLNILTHDIRHANWNGNDELRISPLVQGSGIIFTGNNVPAGVRDGANINQITQQSINDNSGIVEKSDQLTIQYRPNYVVKEGASGSYSVDSGRNNCEGVPITFNNNTDANREFEKAMIVQRYYVTAMPNTGSTGPKRYGLYCDAGYYVESSNRIQEFPNSTPQLLMSDVEAFKVKYAVKDDKNNIRYMSLGEYMGANTTGDVVAVDLGLLVRSVNPVGGDEIINDNQVFDLFKDGGNYGKVSLKSEQKSDSKYLRYAFSQRIAIRNTAGAN